jgi:pimeloyl-ACP methyl ester carboxylesterase
MGRLRTGASLAAALCLISGCTQTGADQGSKSTPSSRTLAGRPLVACTIKGESPVKAQAQALCGALPVREDRSGTGGRTVELRVAVVPAVAAGRDAVPLFLLAGGPGEAATQFFAWLPSVFKEVHARRDIVLVDQRGTGDSNRLTLPEMPDPTGLSTRAVDARLSRWSRDALGSIDADPRFYTTAAAADDLDDVREALGYHQVDLYGTSYGGTVAQYYLRQHEGRVRAVVLDGSSPVDVPVLELLGHSSQAALDLLFRRCADDAACHRAFPHLAAEWQSLLARLATPLTITDPASHETAVIDRVKLADAVHSALLTEASAARVPLALHLAARGQWVPAAQLIGTPPSGGPTLVMADEILCSEAWARFTPAGVNRLSAGSYALPRELADAGRREAMCRHLPTGLVPADDAAAVHTTLPVLWLVADGDPQDPPANLAEVPAQQPNSRVVVVPTQQHVVGQLGCLPSLVAAFLDAGSAKDLDVSCARTARPLPFRLS